MSRLWEPLDAAHPEAGTEMILALIKSLRRTVTASSADWRFENTLALGARSLGLLLDGGNADPEVVADVLLTAELETPPSDFPWIALVFERLGRGAKPGARAMQELLDQRDLHAGPAVTGA